MKPRKNISLEQRQKGAIVGHEAQGHRRQNQHHHQNDDVDRQKLGRLDQDVGGRKVALDGAGLFAALEKARQQSEPLVFGARQVELGVLNRNAIGGDGRRFFLEQLHGAQGHHVEDHQANDKCFHSEKERRHPPTAQGRVAQSGVPQQRPLLTRRLGAKALIHYIGLFHEAAISGGCRGCR